MINNEVKKWLQNRLKEVGYEEFEPQVNVICNEEYIHPVKPLVAALGTSGGKTVLATLKLEEFYRHPENVNKKSIFFAAAKADTRDNVKETFENLNVNFSYCVIDNPDKKGEALLEALESDCQVIVLLPHTWNAVKDEASKILPKIDGWFIKDEAHKWYFNRTVQNMLKKANPAYQLLLTGTPYDFTAKKDDFLIYYCSVEELQDMGKCGDADVITVATNYDFRRSDYHGNGELKSSLRWSKDVDEKAIKTVLKTMVQVVGSKWTTNTWRKISGLLGQLDRTIIYAKNREQGKHFSEVLSSMPALEGKVLYSDSQVDKDGSNIRLFKKQEGHIFLIVVDRVMEGYSDDELMNIVDFKLSHKPSLLQQMLGRLFRISKLQPNKRKRFYKVVPRNEVGYVEELMMGVVHLCTKHYYQIFDNNSSKLEVPVVNRKKNRKPDPQPNPPKQKTRKRVNLTVLTAFEDAGMSLNVDAMKSFIYKTSKEFELTKLMNLSLVKNQYLGVVQRWTKEEVHQSALKYKTKEEWKEKDPKPAYAAYDKGWMDEVTTHMEGNKPKGYWTKKNCREEAKKYKTKGEFFNNSGTAYSISLKKKWLNEFYPNQTRRKRTDPSIYTYEYCKKQAKKYSGRTEYNQNCPSGFYAIKNKWMEEFFPEIVFRGETPEVLIQYIVDNKIKDVKDLYKKRSNGTVQRYKKWVKEGKIENVLNYKPTSSIVLQYTLDGKFVAEYKNPNQAAKVVNGDSAAIRGCAKGETKQSYGYVWKWKGNNNNFTLKTK